MRGQGRQPRSGASALSWASSHRAVCREVPWLLYREPSTENLLNKSDTETQKVENSSFGATVHHYGYTSIHCVLFLVHKEALFFSVLGICDF